HAEAAYYKGLAYYESNELDKAITFYSQAIASNPQYVYAYNDRASVKRAKADYAGAIADYEKALSIDNSLVFIHNNLGSAYRLNKNYPKAIEAYTSAYQKNPAYLLALINR